jgi:hypothetical protein
MLVESMSNINDRLDDLSMHRRPDSSSPSHSTPPPPPPIRNNSSEIYNPTPGFGGTAPPRTPPTPSSPNPFQNTPNPRNLEPPSGNPSNTSEPISCPFVFKNWALRIDYLYATAVGTPQASDDHSTFSFAHTLEAWEGQIITSKKVQFPYSKNNPFPYINLTYKAVENIVMTVQTHWRMPKEVADQNFCLFDFLLPSFHEHMKSGDYISDVSPKKEHYASLPASVLICCLVFSTLPLCMEGAVVNSLTSTTFEMLEFELELLDHDMRDRFTTDSFLININVITEKVKKLPHTNRSQINHL